MLSEWSTAQAARLLCEPDSNSHKYSRGVLGLRTGSTGYPGAAVLTAEAAWKTGLGLVRFTPALHDAPARFGLPTPAAAVLAARPETVFTEFGGPDNASAWLIGSGTDPAQRSPAEREALLELLASRTPIVVDAGALGLLAEQRPCAPVIATPHLGEFRSLWQAAFGAPLEEDADPTECAIRLARELDVTILLKGSRTIAAAPNGVAHSSGPATPWLATAGTGDVLAGILGALVAGHAREVSKERTLLAQLGSTAAVLHDTAARIASARGAAATDPAGVRATRGAEEDWGEHAPITALDVALAIPRAVAKLHATRLPG